MTLEQWQTSAELVTWASKLFSDPNWQLLRQMLDTEHPKNYQKQYLVMDKDRANMELGIIYGYDRLLNNIEQSAKLHEEPIVIQPTYASETESAPILNPTRIKHRSTK